MASDGTLRSTGAFAVGRLPSAVCWALSGAPVLGFAATAGTITSLSTKSSTVGRVLFDRRSSESLDDSMEDWGRLVPRLCVMAFSGVRVGGELEEVAVSGPDDGVTGSVSNEGEMCSTGTSLLASSTHVY